VKMDMKIELARQPADIGRVNLTFLSTSATHATRLAEPANQFLRKSA
jgi:hypothetical protein